MRATRPCIARRWGDTVTLRTLSTLPEPLAPSIAARRAGVTLSVGEAVRACREIGEAHDVTLIEGAGGLLVSITDETDMAGLAAALSAPLVLVVRPALGTLNHTLLSVEAAARRGLDVALIVVSGYASTATIAPAVVEAENLRYLQERLPAIPMLVLGRQNPRRRTSPVRCRPGAWARPRRCWRRSGWGRWTWRTRSPEPAGPDRRPWIVSASPGRLGGVAQEDARGESRRAPHQHQFGLGSHAHRRVLALARAADEAGVETLWLSEGFGHDAFSGLALLARETHARSWGPAS